MISVKDKSLCTGCFACKNICPKNSIDMRIDDEGFLYPAVDGRTCINCSVCEKICPVINETETLSKKICYAAYSKDQKVRKNSSSGGIFTALALHFINTGGYVFGAAFDGVSNVKHICINNSTDIEKLRTSKYIQSETGDSFTAAKALLDKGKTVLFTGTPCQIAGLKSFLGKDYSNLYTQDIVCHGVPSNLVWQKYIKKKQKQYREKIKSVNFRNKEFGWKDFSVCYEFETKSENTVHRNDLFFKAFLKNIILRPSCYDCKFKGAFVSDITLGDFWGIENFLPEIDDNNGISVIICNSEKGKKLLTDVRDSLILKGVDYETAVKYNTAAVKSVPKPGSRDIFFKRIKHRNIEKELSLFVGEDKKSVNRVQFFEDYRSVKDEKGKVYSCLWAIKNRLITH